MFGTEKVICPKNSRGGWSGFGTVLVWIDPNYLGSRCSNPNKRYGWRCNVFLPSRVRVTSQVLLYSLLYSQWKPTIFINQEFSWLSYVRNQLNLLCSISNFAKILFSPLKFSLSNMPYNNVIVFSLRSSKITVNQTSACTELIFITTVANLHNCCILLCSYCVVLLAKQQG